MNPWIALLVFASAFATDVVWARYSLAVNKLNRWAASMWSVGIFAMGAIGISAYIENIWYLVPVALGGACGTFVAVTHARRQPAVSAGSIEGISPVS